MVSSSLSGETTIDAPAPRRGMGVGEAGETVETAEMGVVMEVLLLLVWVV